MSYHRHSCGSDECLKDRMKSGEPGTAMTCLSLHKRAEVEALLDDIKAGRPLARSAKLNELAARVAAGSGKPIDVEAWAARLAADVAGLAD